MIDSTIQTYIGYSRKNNCFFARFHGFKNENEARSCLDKYALLPELFALLQEHVQTDISTFSDEEMKAVDPASLLGRSIAALAKAGAA